MPARTTVLPSSALRGGKPQKATMISQRNKMVLPGLLAVLYAMRSLCTTYSKDDTDHDGILDAYPYRPNNVVMTTEFCKLCLATCLFFWHRAQYRAGRTSEPAKYLVSGPVLLKFSVPAFLYMCSNNLGFLALQYLDAPTFQVGQNLGIPILAIIHRAIMKRKKTVTQWLGVVTLMLGMMVIGADKLTLGDKAWSSMVKGLVYLLVLEVISATSGVYTEKLLKTLPYCIDFQNILLYTWGVVFCILANILSGDEATNHNNQGGGGGFFSGFDSRTLMVVLVNAFLGQIVSRVQKYADNVIKMFAGALGVIVTMVASAKLFGTQVTMLFNLGTGVYFVASALYMVPAETLQLEL